MKSPPPVDAISIHFKYNIITDKVENVSSFLCTCYQIGVGLQERMELLNQEFIQILGKLSIPRPESARLNSNLNDGR